MKTPIIALVLLGGIIISIAYPASARGEIPAQHLETSLAIITATKTPDLKQTTPPSVTLLPTPESPSSQQDENEEDVPGVADDMTTDPGHLRWMILLGFMILGVIFFGIWINRRYFTT